jgi:DNA replication protein DnaC
VSAPEPEITAQVREVLLRLKLPVAAEELIRRLTQSGHAAALPTLLEVLQLEAADRHERKVERLLKASHLPMGKTFQTLEQSRLPAPLVSKLHELAGGDFVEDAMNVLLFGLPGVGKTHAACALGDALARKGHSVLFVPTFRLVQELLAAKRDLTLPRALRKLDLFDVLILDDIGYVQQAPEEVEVLFTLLAERYERRSLVITSNLVFSAWDRIFKNPMTTAAAIDRVIHHAVILEFGEEIKSFRGEGAGNKATSKPKKETASRARRGGRR